MDYFLSLGGFKSDPKKDSKVVPKGPLEIEPFLDDPWEPESIILCSQACVQKGLILNHPRL